MLDPSCAIVRKWADDLADALGRPASEIGEHGPEVGDLPLRALQVRFADGPEVRFNYAFFVMSFSNKAVAVFAEHCGYFVLPIAELEIAVEEFGRGELM